MCRESKASYLKIKIIYFTIYFSINLSSTISTSIPICIFNHYESVKQNKCGQPLGIKNWYPEERLYQSDTMFTFLVALSSESKAKLDSIVYF